MSKRYTVSDGKLVLTLEEAEEGGFVVTSPLDPGLVTEAATIREAFVNARDALRTLAEGRLLLAKTPKPPKARANHVRAGRRKVQLLPR